MSTVESLEKDRPDPQLPPMVGARVASAVGGVLLALGGGILAANLPTGDPSILMASVHQLPAHCHDRLCHGRVAPGRAHLGQREIRPPIPC